MLQIGVGFALPDDAVSQTIAILARRGAGKTSTGKVLVEELVDAGLQAIVIDPTGVWYGLRSSVDGTRTSDLTAVAEATGYSRDASTISAGLSKLRALGLIDGWRVADDFIDSIR